MQCRMHNSAVESTNYADKKQICLEIIFNLIKDQLPKANSSLYDAYKEIIPAIIKQHKDNTYFIKKVVPSN